MSRYLIGIDLGTTNSALAFIDTQQRVRQGNPPVRTFVMPQLIGPGQMGERNLLPSFVYLPGQHDLPAGASALPWKADPGFIVGEFARNHGAKVPGRLVSSAKSWLCHPGVDRTSPLLPWTAPPDVVRLSPLDVSTKYLRHMVDAWNSGPGKVPGCNLEDQTVVLTVPASFDDVARSLTAQAAKDAGLKNVTLLEEPQAAFYCWLGMTNPQEVGLVKPGMACLVIDVGGGTSDFSLIRAAEASGELTFLREAVGDHLLLGGDNMDLALARYAEAKLTTAKLDAAQFGFLVQSCRQAKEILLSPSPPESFPITVMGRGRSVLAGTLHTTITREEVHKVVFDGFFPLTERETEPIRTAKTGLQEMGLPYVADPAISRHLAAFLKRQLPAGDAPDAILFNGGVFQPQSLRDRILEVMTPWYADKTWTPLMLTTPSLDLAVAWGAAFQAWLRFTGGRRIGGGIARSYYVGIRTAEQEQGILCVVPRGLEEGRDIQLPKPELELALGQPVSFPLFTSTVRGDDQPGQILHVAPEQLMVLPPLTTILRGGKRSGIKNVGVHLEARCTEIGTLELFCVAQEGDNRWKLEFNIREVMQTQSQSESDEPAPLLDIWPETLVLAGAAKIRSTFSEGIGEPKELTKILETSLEATRNDWSMALCRRLWEFLEEVSDSRSRTPAHLSRWYNLAGFCLRPGFGDTLDRFRIDQLWKKLSAPPKTTGLYMPVEGGADYWIMWRRVSGGLNAPIQMNLFNRIRSQLLPNANARNVLRPAANELSEMWRTAASLERIDSRTREQLGTALLKQLNRSPVPSHVFWCLARLGARVLLYGPLNGVLHPDIIEGWLKELLKFEPASDNEKSQWLFALTQMTRLTGSRALDIDPQIREEVLKKMREAGASEEQTKMLTEVVELAAGEQSQRFGEALPIGLRLAGG